MGATDSTAALPLDLDKLRIERTALTQHEADLLARLQCVRSKLAANRELLAQAEQAHDAPRQHVRHAEEEWRRTVRELGTFTISELRAELGCSHASAAAHVKAMIEARPAIVRPAGRVLGKACYEYIRPDAEPVTRGHLSIAPEVQAIHDAPERGTVMGVSRKGNANSIASKVVREACREALDRGWELRPKGDGHYVLVKDGRRVPVAGTPSNPDGSADIIRRMTGGRRS